MQIHPETKHPLDKYQQHGKLDVHILYNIHIYIYVYIHNILSLNQSITLKWSTRIQQFQKTSHLAGQWQHVEPAPGISAASNSIELR